MEIIYVYSFLGFGITKIPYRPEYRFMRTGMSLNCVDIKNKIVFGNSASKLIEFYELRYPEFEYEKLSITLLDMIRNRDIENGYIQRMLYDADDQGDYRLITEMVNRKKEKFEFSELVIDLG